MSAVTDMVGQTFGRLTVLSRDGSTHGRALWRCRCSCGSIVMMEGKRLRQGAGSCGCVRREKTVQRSQRHGLSGTKEYRTWKHIKGRCFCPTDDAYSRYGGRGISMASEWATDFGKFLADVGPAPGAHMTIERIDNDRGYEPGNVRWATRAEQNRNTRRNVYVEIDGRRMVLKDACRQMGVSPWLAASYVRKGADPHEAIRMAAAR